MVAMAFTAEVALAVAVVLAASVPGLRARFARR
jgi:hypothetical protein